MRKFIVLVLLLSLALPIYAQEGDDTQDDETPISAEAAELQQAIEALTIEAPPPASSSAPQGVNILFMLAGAAGIFAVGMAMIGRDRPSVDQS